MIPHTELTHRADPLVDLEVLLRNNAHRLHHHQKGLVVLSTLHVVRDTHPEVQKLRRASDVVLPEDR